MNDLRYILQQEPLSPGSMRQEQGEQHLEIEDGLPVAPMGGKAIPMPGEDAGDARLLNHER